MPETRPADPAALIDELRRLRAKSVAAESALRAFYARGGSDRSEWDALRAAVYDAGETLETALVVNADALLSLLSAAEADRRRILAEVNDIDDWLGDGVFDAARLRDGLDRIRTILGPVDAAREARDAE